MGWGKVINLLSKKITIRRRARPEPVAAESDDTSAPAERSPGPTHSVDMPPPSAPVRAETDEQQHPAFTPDEIQTEQLAASASVDPSAMQRQLLTMFYQQGLTTQYLTLVAVVVTIIAMWTVTDRSLLIPWGVWFVTLVIIRWLYMKRFLNIVDSVDEFGSWEVAGLIGTVLAGLSWGMLGVVYDFSWPPFYQVFVLGLLGGLAGVSTASYSSSLRANTLFMVSMFGPVIIRFLLENSATSRLYVLAILTFFGCIYVAGIKAHKSVVDNVRLRLVNEDLVKNLSQVNTELNQEIAQRSQAEAGLKQERKLFVKGPVIVFRWKAVEGWPVEYASPNVSVWGLNAKELMQNRTYFAQYVHPDDKSRVAKLGYQNSDNAGRDFVELDYRIILPDGEERWVFERTIPVRDDTGKLTSINGYLLDINDRKRAEQLFYEEKERAQVTLHSIGDGVITTDNANCVTYMNPVAERMTELSLSQAKGKVLENVFRALDQNTGRSIQNLQKHWNTRSEEMHSVRLRSNKDVAYSMATIKDDQHRSIGSVVVMRDATRILALTRKLAYYASHDALTDTLNRREFERCLDLALKSAVQHKLTHVVLYIDLDQFKIVNDTCGHRAGDHLLQLISDLLAQNIRSGDVIARLGGDEFAILLHRCSLDQAKVIAEKLRRATHNARLAWESHVFDIGISVGAVGIDKDSESVSAVMSAADMACYTAKDLGKDRVHVYEKSDAEMNSRRREMHWVNHLHQALKQNRLTLFQQEIMSVSNDSDDMRRAEILLRLFDEDGQLVPASMFLPALERYGLGNTIDRWVVRECFSIIASGEASNNTIYSINISGPSLSQTDFLNYIESQFEAYSVKGSQICFEITETAAVSHFRNAREFISELKALGCSFALDDFGSGLSSFAYLKDLAVDYLKIDGAFIQNIVKDNVDRALVNAIKDVGHVMLIDTVAEHVENQEIMDIVAAVGIDYAQGSFIGIPKPFGRRAQKLAYMSQSKQQTRMRAVT